MSLVDLVVLVVFTTHNYAWSCLTSIICSIFLGSAMEILQFAGVAVGTFDVWDIVAEAIGTVTGAIIIKQAWRR